MSPVRITRHPGRFPGLQLRLCGLRVHHGLAGLVMIQAGLLLALHDRRDWRTWLNLHDR